MKNCTDDLVDVYVDAAFSLLRDYFGRDAFFNDVVYLCFVGEINTLIATVEIPAAAYCDIDYSKVLQIHFFFNLVLEISFSNC